MFNTIDDTSYYARTGTAKKDMIYDFVMSKKDIHSIYDVGCNNGDISYSFIAEGIDVLGIDASKKLNIKKPYKFIQKDVTKMNDIHLNDCTFFLSLYHHLFGNIGIELADNLFYQLLLRTKYLIFDTGTPE